MALSKHQQKRYLFRDDSPSPFVVVRRNRRYEVQWWRTQSVVMSDLLKSEAEEVAMFLNEKLKKSLDRAKAPVR